MPLHVKPLGGNLPKLPPPNPKYKNVKPHVNSGFNEIKAKKLTDETQVNSRFVRREHFRRVKVSKVYILCVFETVILLPISTACLWPNASHLNVYFLTAFAVHSQCMAVPKYAPILNIFLQSKSW